MQIETTPLRFRKAQAKTLRNIANRLRAKGYRREVVQTLEMASRAARAGQPMTVASTHAERIADTFARFGAARPTVG